MTRSEILALPAQSSSRLVRASDTGGYYAIDAGQSGADAALVQYFAPMAHAAMLALPSSSEWRFVAATDTETLYMIPPGKTGTQAKSLLHADGDGNIAAGVVLEDVTGTTPASGQLGRVGNRLVIGDGVTPEGIQASSAGGGLVSFLAPEVNYDAQRVVVAADHGATIVASMLRTGAVPQNAGPWVRVPDSADIPVGFSCRVVIPRLGYDLGFFNKRLTFDPTLQVFAQLQDGRLLNALPVTVTLAAGQEYFFPTPVRPEWYHLSSISAVSTPAAGQTTVTSSVAGMTVGAYNGGTYYLRVFDPSGKVCDFPVVSNDATTITVSGNASSFNGCNFALKQYYTLASWVDPALVTSDPLTTVGGIIVSVSTLGGGRRTEVRLRNRQYYVYASKWLGQGVGTTDLGGDIIHPTGLCSISPAASTPTVNFTVPGCLYSEVIGSSCDVMLYKTGAQEWTAIGTMV